MDELWKKYCAGELPDIGLEKPAQHAAAAQKRQSYKDNNLPRKKSQADKILESHGYTPRNVAVYEIIGERFSHGTKEDVDTLIFAPNIYLAFFKYFTKMKGTLHTQNEIAITGVNEVYSLSTSTRNNIIFRMNQDPDLNQKLDLMLEKYFIIGPGHEREEYRKLAMHMRIDVQREVFQLSIDKVIKEIESRIRCPK